ncbi:histidine phosphatase family protein [Companilactobacillus huachuanensis]|uniref:Histidine phosphatase family protein n=1 Tax=Companilactobacillus huachuanensis TaxID=2559914 RepID=A0ABW1RKH3_9LACO|nr:histidine phosphatase family protein [Companilactobacillus huachuanensis]
MSKTLYLMLHGQTLFNQLHLIQGSCDSPLTEEGIDSAKVAGKYFKDAGIKFDHAYSSTQERAADTLELITDQPYQRLKGLKEWDFGVFEAQPEFLNPKNQPERHSYGDFFVQYHGESDYDVQNRMNETLTRIMQQADDGQSILAVSHGGAIHAFLLKWMDWNVMDEKVRLHNCAVVKLTFEDEKFTFEEVIQNN